MEVLKSYKENIAVLVSESDHGIYDALNKGINIATGDVVGFLHSDDIFFDKYVLEKVRIEFLDNDVDAIYGDLEYVSQNDVDKIVRYWRAGEYKSGLWRYGWMPPHPTFYMKRDCYKRFGGFSLDYPISADYESLLRYIKHHRVNVSYIPSVMVKMRVGGASNNSFSNLLKKYNETNKVLKCYYDFPQLITTMKMVRKIFQFSINSKFDKP